MWTDQGSYLRDFIVIRNTQIHKMRIAFMFSLIIQITSKAQEKLRDGLTSWALLKCVVLSRISFFSDFTAIKRIAIEFTKIADWFQLCGIFFVCRVTRNWNWRRSWKGSFTSKKACTNSSANSPNRKPSTSQWNRSYAFIFNNNKFLFHQTWLTYILGIATFIYIYIYIYIYYIHCHFKK